MSDSNSPFRRIRRALRRKGSPSGEATENDGLGLGLGQDVPELADGSTAGADAGAAGNYDKHPTITHTQMRETADNQNASALFARLPLEIRRLIYLEVWRDYIQSCRQLAGGDSTITLHLYTDSLKHGAFCHTACLLRKGSPPEEDGQVIEPWPFNTTQTSPPMWYMLSWVRRLHWDTHWKCQSAIMKQWDPATGSAAPREQSPFLALFLACKKMYWEAVVSIFNNAALVFTSSEDAYRFFVHNKHPFAAAIRSLEFHFTNPNDHLFLSQVRRETSTCGADEGRTGAEPDSSATISGRIEVFGPELWAELIEGLREATPGLRDLEIAIGGRVQQLQRNLMLDSLGGCGAEGEDEDELTEPKDASAWEIAGKVEMVFKTDGLRYVQNAGKMVVQR